jgi:putative ABC transport system permease protein
MLSTYIKSAWRSLIRNRTFSFINIFGLALGMAICLIVLVHVREQISYDKFQPHRDRLVRVITELRNRDGQQFRLASTPLPLAQALVQNYEGVEAVTRIYPVSEQMVRTNTKRLKLKAAFTDTSFLRIFSFKLSEGNAGVVLNMPNEIILSASTAGRLFGDGNATGKVVQFENYGDFIVKGVLDDSLTKSHISFDAYLSLSSVPRLEKDKKLNLSLDVWNNWSAGYTYVRLRNGQQSGSLQRALDKISTNLLSTSETKGKENIRFEAQAFNDIILGEELQFTIGNVGSAGKMAAEILIGFVILLSASFNYTNLSIARSLKRGREVGIRKVAGALRIQVFSQFIIESMLNAVIAFVMSYVILLLMIDYAPFLAGGISPTLFSDDPWILLWFIGFIMFSGLLAGTLPALALSSFRPVEVLKNLTQVKLFGGIGFRKVLIVSQFALAILITIFAGVFSRQFDYMANADPGYRRDNMLTVALQGADYKYLSEQLRNQNGVVKVAAVSKTLGRGPSGKSVVRWDKAKDPFWISHFDVDSNFITIAGLKLMAGTGFANGASVAAEREILVNEQTLQIFNIASPGDAIGKSVVVDDTLTLVISGVLAGFHFHGMESQIAPLILRNRAKEFTLLQVQTNHKSPVLESSVRNTWKRINPSLPFDHYWLKERLQEQQSAGETVSTLGFLAFMAITIAVLGMLGMVVYVTQTREKEIGIRKIMGAGVQQIMMLLSKGFLKMIFIAGCIAIPLGYIGSYFFLNMFATRISPGAGLMLAGFLGILFLSLVTICSQIYRVAIANPAQSLRSE